MSKRLRFIGKSLPLRFDAQPNPGDIYSYEIEGGYCDLVLLHPATGKQGVFNLRVHESGDLVIHGPPWGFRTLSRILGDGAEDPKRRILRVIETGYRLQDELNKDYYLPK